MVTQEIAKKYVSYCLESGVVTRKLLDPIDKTSKMYNTRFAGTSPTSKDSKGYLVMRLEGKTYKVSRLIWLYTTGDWPDQVDHENRIRDDNRWVNLKDVSNQQNSWNRGKYAEGKTTSKHAGVSLHRGTNKWRAQVAIDGKKEHLGLFETEEEASGVYQQRFTKLTKEVQ
jgi:hypothetical protein